MATQIKTTVLPAGPTKRVWVNKHHLPQFGGKSLTSPVWEVECEGVRYSGHRVMMDGEVWCVYDPTEPEHGPHAWVELLGEVLIYTAAEEAA